MYVQVIRYLRLFNKISEFSFMFYFKVLVLVRYVSDCVKQDLFEAVCLVAAYWYSIQKFSKPVVLMSA